MLVSNELGAASAQCSCIKMSHDSEGTNVIHVALDTCCEASVMNKDLFDTSFRDTNAVVSYTSLRNKALQAADSKPVYNTTLS